MSNVNDIRSLNDKVWAEVSATAVASTNAVAQVYDVTVTVGSLAGRYLILDNGDRAMNVADTMISLSGDTGTLDASGSFRCMRQGLGSVAYRTQLGIPA